MNILKLIGREKLLFENDINVVENNIKQLISNHKFLVLGGAGSIGQSVVIELFKRQPIKLHVVDISENNLVELVRDIRSSFGYISGDFQTFALDIGSNEYDAFIENDGCYDYVLNLSALKHVRSEKDPYTLMRMIKTNVLNTNKTIEQSIRSGVKKYFCVSTDKAANPVNMMGASKRIMEMFLMKYSQDIVITTARFANVAFSDGSLLHGFNQRLLKKQPIVAPNDIKRYFVVPQEAGELCVLSCLLGENRDIFFPKLSEDLHLITFSEIAEKYLHEQGFESFICQTEEQSRSFDFEKYPNHWPCLFTSSDTTGEKDFEEFFTDKEVIDLDKFENLGIIKNELHLDIKKLTLFEDTIYKLLKDQHWNKNQIVELFNMMIPNFDHKETGKYLDSKM
ncbi:MAG: UDP-N-acetylglucosamine 4,6-dehydratase [Flavobacterium sp.]